MACIEARGLRKTYGTTVALDGINLRVEEGRILGLIGPNGAGKSTALNAILGLTPYEGELRVLGRNPWNERDRGSKCFAESACFYAGHMISGAPFRRLVSPRLRGLCW